MNKKKLVATFNPPLNQTPTFDKSELTYERIKCGGEFSTKVYTQGKSTFFAALMKQDDEKFKGIVLCIIEIRMSMPMIEVVFKVTDNPEAEVIPHPRLEFMKDEVQLYFPIDEEDEDDITNIIKSIAPEIDLTKLTYLK